MGGCDLCFGGGDVSFEGFVVGREGEGGGGYGGRTIQISMGLPRKSENGTEVGLRSSCDAFVSATSSLETLWSAIVGELSRQELGLIPCHMARAIALSYETQTMFSCGFLCEIPVGMCAKRGLGATDA